MSRDETIKVRVSAEEKAALEKAAEDAHMSLSTWLRKIALDLIKRRKS
jgi:uncharacterized protein (DUF1778 family)